MDMETARTVNESMTSNITFIHTSDLAMHKNNRTDMKRQLVNDIRNGDPPKRQSRKMRDDTLYEYEQSHGPDYDCPITTTKQGKHFYNTLPNQLILLRDHPMKSFADRHHYGLEPSIEGASFVLAKYILHRIDKSSALYEEGRLDIFKNFGDTYPNLKSFSEPDEWFGILKTLSMVNRNYYSMIKDIERLRDLDFTPLRQPRLNYEEQMEIDENHVDMVTSLLIWSNLDPGVAVRYVSGEYTAEYRDPDETRQYVHGNVSQKDEKDLYRIITEGVPYKLNWTEERVNKLTQLAIGNQKSVSSNREIVDKTINKEHKYSNILSCRGWVVYFSPFCRHNAQGMNLKKGKARLVWDATTIPPEAPWLTVMNQIADKSNMPEVTYGKVLHLFMLDILNWRASYPNEDIIIPAGVDMTSAFRWPKVNPNLTGALGFMINDLYHLPTGMVFGHVESAASFEPVRRAIEIMSIAEFESSKDLVSIHSEYLDMLDWSILNDLPEQNELQRSAFCSVVTGIPLVNRNGTMVPKQTRPRIFVDDALAASTKAYIKRFLAAIIEAIFNIMGKPDPRLRRIPLSMEKWLEAIINYQNILLGLRWNTRKLTVAIPHDYLDELRTLLRNSGLPFYRKTFTVSEVSKIIGKLGRIGQAVNWAYHLMSQLYASVAYALTQNRNALASNSSEFKTLMKVVKGELSFEVLGKNSDTVTSNTINYAKSKLAKMPHSLNQEYPIITSMKRELQVMMELLEDPTIQWESPIAHLVNRDPTAVGWTDACTSQTGGFNITMRYIWHVEFPLEIKSRTIKYISAGPDLININVLEFVGIIINFAAALTSIEEDGLPTDDPFPILLNYADNRSSVKWIRLCTSSSIGRCLALFLCFLLIDSPLGINAKYLPGDENFIADAISRLKQEKGANNFFYDYSTLKQNYPILRNCRSFQPSQELLSMLWTIILSKNSPTLAQVRTLKQRGLGKLSTSDSQN